MVLSARDSTADIPARSFLTYTNGEAKTDEIYPHDQVKLPEKREQVTDFNEDKHRQAFRWCLYGLDQHIKIQIL